MLRKSCLQGCFQQSAPSGHLMGQRCIQLPRGTQARQGLPSGDIQNQERTETVYQFRLHWMWTRSILELCSWMMRWLDWKRVYSQSGQPHCHGGAVSEKLRFSAEVKKSKVRSQLHFSRCSLCSLKKGHSHSLHSDPTKDPLPCSHTSLAQSSPGKILAPEMTLLLLINVNSMG